MSRLEEIKIWVSVRQGKHPDDVRWLISRIEELEKENERLQMHIAGRPDNCIICGDDFVPRFESAAGLHYCKSCEEESE